MIPRAEAPFKWVGISLLWAPSSYLPTQVKGGQGRGWAQCACMKLCAGPAPSSRWTHGASIQLALSPQYKETICAAASGRGAGKTVWAMSLARWVVAEPAGKGLSGTQQSIGRVSGLSTPVPRPPAPWGRPGTGMPGSSQEPAGCLGAEGGSRTPPSAPTLASTGRADHSPSPSIVAPLHPGLGSWKKGKENRSSCE